MCSFAAEHSKTSIRIRVIAARQHDRSDQSRRGTRAEERSDRNIGILPVRHASFPACVNREASGAIIRRSGTALIEGLEFQTTGYENCVSERNKKKTKVGPVNWSREAIYERRIGRYLQPR
jgi:hypothetical protein